MTPYYIHLVHTFRAIRPMAQDCQKGYVGVSLIDVLTGMTTSASIRYPANIGGTSSHSRPTPAIFNTMPHHLATINKIRRMLNSPIMSLYTRIGVHHFIEVSKYVLVRKHYHYMVPYRMMKPASQQTAAPRGKLKMSFSACLSKSSLISGRPN